MPSAVPPGDRTSQRRVGSADTAHTERAITYPAAAAGARRKAGSWGPREPRAAERRLINVDLILAKGEARGPLTFDDVLTAVIIALIYLSITVFIVTSEKRTKGQQSERAQKMPGREAGALS